MLRHSASSNGFVLPAAMAVALITCVSTARADLPGDINGDGVVDITDFQLFAGCMAGPDVTTPPPGCDPNDFAVSDLEADLDVDLHDFALFAAQFGATTTAPPDYYLQDTARGAYPDFNTVQVYDFFSWAFVRGSSDGSRMAVIYANQEYDDWYPYNANEDIEICLSTGAPPSWASCVPGVLNDGRPLGDGLPVQIADAALTNTSRHLVGWIEVDVAGNYNASFKVSKTNDDGQTWSSPQPVAYYQSIDLDLDLDIAANDAGEIGVLLYLDHQGGGGGEIINPADPQNLMPTSDRLVLAVFDENFDVTLETIVGANDDPPVTWPDYDNFMDIVGGPDDVFYVLYRRTSDSQIVLYTHDSTHGNSSRLITTTSALPQATRTRVNQEESVTVRLDALGIWDTPRVGTPVQRISALFPRWPAGSASSPDLVAVDFGILPPSIEVKKMDISGNISLPITISDTVLGEGQLPIPLCNPSRFEYVGCDECYYFAWRGLGAASGHTNGVGWVVSDLYYAGSILQVLEWIPDGFLGPAYYSKHEKIVISAIEYP